jgi:hypothetical protein
MVDICWTCTLDTTHASTLMDGKLERKEWQVTLLRGAVCIAANGQSTSSSWYRAPLGAHDQICYLHPFFRDNYFVVLLVGCPLWWEDASVTCSAIGDWSGSRRTYNHILPSQLRLLSYLFVASYESQGLRWRFSNPPPHGDDNTDFTL